MTSAYPESQHEGRPIECSIDDSVHIVTEFYGQSGNCWYEPANNPRTNPRRKPCSDQCNYLFRIRPVEGVIGVIRRLGDENDIAVGFGLIEVGVF